MTRSTTPAHPNPGAGPQSPPPSVTTALLAAPGPTVPDPVFERLFRERIVFLGQELDDAVANRICAQLLLLAAEDRERDIALYINSAGGSVTAAMAVHDTMCSIEPDVATWAIGFTASTGQFLLSAGARGKRHALPHARILMHRPTAALDGSASDIAVRAGVHAALRREMAELTAGHTGRGVEEVIADCDQDRWFTAAQARAYGLVDHVVTP
jgi:ATP-dependent Clp protease protease subunit